MANDFLSLTDVAVFDNLDADLDISDVLDQAPLIASLFTQVTDGRTFLYAKKTENPVTGFRAANDGREFDHSVYLEVTETLGILDASFAVDVAVAAADKRGSARLMMQEMTNHLRSAFFAAEDQILNGTDAVNGFTSLTSKIDADMTLADDALAAGEVGVPVYFLRTGMEDCALIVGEMGKIMVGDTVVTPLAGATGTFPAYYTPVTSWLGSQVGSKYSGAYQAIVNGLDDDKLSELFELFPAGRPGNLIVTTRAGLGQLQRSRTATTTTGATAPFPSTWDATGTPIPIIVTDALANTVGA